MLRDVLNDKLESYDQEETWAGLGELGLPLLSDAIRAIRSDPPSNLTKSVALLAAIGPPAKEALPLLEDHLAKLRREAAAKASGIRERDDGRSTILRLEQAIRTLRGI